MLVLMLPNCSLLRFLQSQQPAGMTMQMSAAGTVRSVCSCFSDLLVVLRLLGVFTGFCATGGLSVHLLAEPLRCFMSCVYSVSV